MTKTPILSHLSEGIVLVNDPSAVCGDVCARAKAKATKTPFPPSASLASNTGELTHADLCYIGVPKVLGSFTQFLILSNDAARYMSIYLLS